MHSKYKNHATPREILYTKIIIESGQVLYEFQIGDVICAG